MGFFMIKKQEIKSSKTVKQKDKKAPKKTVKTNKTSKTAVKEVLKKESGKIKKETKLTDKQLFFCREYLIDLNSTQACIRAGYSKNSADKI